MPAASAPEDSLPFGLAALGGIGALFLFIRRNGKA
jgi:MYXO-CTERM domain-containing protein